MNCYRNTNEKWLFTLLKNGVITPFRGNKKFISFSLDEKSGGMDNFGDECICFNFEEIIKQGGIEIFYEPEFMEKYPEICMYITGYSGREDYESQHDPETDLSWKTTIEDYEHEQEIIIKQLKFTKNLINWVKFNKQPDKILKNLCSKYNIPIMNKNSIVEKILTEAKIEVMYLFDEAIPNRYGFILKDKYKYNSQVAKYAIITELEKYRKISGDGLPIEEMDPRTFVATQDTIDSDNLRNIANNKEEIDALPVVVKYNGINYLIDGHHRTSIALITRENLIDVRVYDLDSPVSMIKEAYKFDDKLPERYSFLYRDTTKFNTPDLKWKCIQQLENYRKNRDRLKTVEVNIQKFVPTKLSTEHAKIPFVVKYFDTYYVIDGQDKPQANIYQGPKLVKVKLLDLDTLKIGLDRKTSFDPS